MRYDLHRLYFYLFKAGGQSDHGPHPLLAMNEERNY